MLRDEKLIPLGEAARLLPHVNGQPVCSSVVWRWVTSGVQGVRLEALRLGRRWVTSRDALVRFGERLAEVSLAEADERRAGARR